MKMSGNTILITGGASGIGFEFAAQLLKLGNTLIITGRDQRRLEDAQRKLPGIHTFQSDVSDPKATSLLFDAVVRKFPGLNVLINNAGIMRKINLQDTGNDLGDIGREIETNLLGPERKVKQFLPHLKTQEEAAIVNVSSGLAFVPLPIAPIDCAAKAGLHSFTQSLRVQRRNTKIKVFELAPPATQTPLLTGDFQAGGTKGVHVMDVTKMVVQAIVGLKSDRWEIRRGQSNVLNLMSRVAPHFILNQLSKPQAATPADTTPR
jgi:uncharacterized oxidoreductase